MSAHTPGPWFVCNPNDPFFSRQVDSNSGGVCFCGSFQREEAEANARLIAAAPETAAERDRLREINAELLHAIETLLGETDDSDYMSQAEREAVARDAIAKYKGGAA